MTRRQIVFCTIALVFTIILGVHAQGALLHSTASAADDFSVYSDSLATNWQNWSWNSTVDFANSTPVENGTASLAVTYDAPWAGLSLRAPALIDTTLYSTITFAIHGGASGTRSLRFFTRSADDGAESTSLAIEANAGIWQTVTISLAELGNPTTIARINWQDRTGSAQPTFYIDNIRLIGSGFVPTPTATPDPTTHGSITVHTSDTSQAVDRRILGTNLPAWLGPERLADTTFRARTIAAGVTVLRMPGGSWSNNYGWLSCERRANQANALPCGDGWESWVARPTDFIDFLQATGTEGMWVVSINSTPEEAAAAVAFFNATPEDTTVIGLDRNGFDWQTAGHWAQLRVDNGNPEPLGIQLWSVGNEVYGGTPASGGAQCESWGWETVWSCNGTEYVNGDGTHEGYSAFRAAMRAVDATIQVGAVGVTPSNEYNDWGTKVVAASGTTMDFYDIHHYGFFASPGSDAALLAAPQSFWTPIMDGVRATFAAQADGRTVPVGVTEYNLFSVQEQDSDQLMTRAVNALYLADTMGRMVDEGVVMANHWTLASGRASNGTDYGLMHEDNGYYRSPQYYIFPLWAQFGSELLTTTSFFDASKEVSVYGGRRDATTYTLMAINKTAQAQPSKITILDNGTALVIGSVMASRLQASTPSAQSVTFNGVADPADDLSNAPAQPVAVSGTSSLLQYEFAPYSVTLLELSIAPTTPTDARQIYLPLVAR